MTKQEEIREGVRDILAELNDESDIGNPYSKRILEYLHSQGVVIKVYEISDDVAQTASDGETRTACGRGMAMVSTQKSVDVFRSFKDMGYVAVEPLIGT